jgi:hypothetical protein
VSNVKCQTIRTHGSRHGSYLIKHHIGSVPSRKEDGTMGAIAFPSICRNGLRVSTVPWNVRKTMDATYLKERDQIALIIILHFL